MTPKRLECWYVGTMLVVIGQCVEIRDQEKTLEYDSNLSGTNTKELLNLTDIPN